MGNRLELALDDYTRELQDAIDRRHSRPWIIQLFGDKGRNVGVMRQWGPGEFVMVLCERGPQEGPRHATFSRGWRRAIREVISERMRETTAGNC
jgi:hypothetical protein